jgi:hypothetical protein
LKRFENHTNIEVGDYVICKYPTIPETRNINIKNLAEFINNNIGYVIRCEEDLDIQYKNVPENINIFFSGKKLDIRTDVDKNKILAFGKTLEELELKLVANKYNI